MTLEAFPWFTVWTPLDTGDTGGTGPELLAVVVPISADTLPIAGLRFLLEPEVGVALKAHDLVAS